jgi:hypothetical protein
VNPGIPETIAAAQAAAIAAADSADRAAAVHESWRRHLAGLLAASLLPRGGQPGLRSGRGHRHR